MLTVQKRRFAATFLPCSPSSFGCEKDTVFYPRLLIVLGLCAGLCACQPTNLAAFIPSAQPAKSSTSEQVTLTTIASFQGSDGSSPLGVVRARDGNFYGVTLFGNLFRLTPDGQRTTIATFEPNFLFNRLIQGSDGNFYGTATGREPTDPGMVFRATPQGQITPVVYFTGRNGSFPNSLIEVENGTFYSTTARGGEHGQGTVFKLTLR